MFFFFKQKTAYEMRISDWSSDVCSSDLIIADDYDARAVKFGEEIANLPPEDRARLIQELMRQDPGALHSWLEMDIIDRMQNEGLISQDEFSAIAQGFVDAYNEGRLTQQQAETFLQVASLQQAAPGIVATQFTQLREFLAAAGDSAATRTFRTRKSVM